MGLRNLKEWLLQLDKETEFDVENGNFAVLEIREANDKFCYFYDAEAGRLVKRFLLKEGPQVDIVCDVVLIKKDGRYTPRLTFWRRDKTKGKSETLTEEELVAEGRVVLIKARVDVGECHETFWRLIEFLRTCAEIDLPAHEFRVADADLVAAFEGHDKASVLTAVRTYLHGELTEADVQMLVDRRRVLDTFHRLLEEPAFMEEERVRLGVRGEEAVWQAFFEANPWIFGYGLQLVSCESYDDDKLERMSTGANVFSGGGKRSDAVMRTRGFIQTLLFGEIKKHTTELLAPTPYRGPDVYQVSAELSGAVAQVHKTAHKAVKKLEDLHRQSDPDGTFAFEVSTIRPRQVVIVGNLRQLAADGEINIEKMTSFELWRRSQLGVEVLTFDELYERTKFIVESQAAGSSSS